jgi:hypothetical protein
MAETANPDRLDDPDTDTETGTDLDPGAAVAFVVGVLAGLDDTDPADVLDALVRVRELREQLSRWEPRLIDAARAGGVSWAQLAPALGVASRQAAERRYLRISPNAADPTMNGEQRVQAARDQRASDRAVAIWARENAADLRRLAGQVASLADLDSPAQASVDRVHDALGQNDSAALLGPLAAAGEQLTRDHPALADRISDIGARTLAVREAGRRRPGQDPAEQTKQEGKR